MTARSLSNLSGIVLSIACIIHCILMPVLLTSLPSWGLSSLASPWFHKSMALLGIAVGVLTLVPGWKQHRRTAVLLWAGCGLLVMNYSAFLGDECCQIPETSVASAAGACCHDACCAATPVEESDDDMQMASVPYWGWLWQHPTVLGAACLAWAHRLNGGCVRKCCQSDCNSVTPLDAAV
ncbi:MerC domain-containing protein [Thalassoroseus pseudoceratinae]|uniref:MerC domain-containing protein n=1 Tax=Thalassoroseus pseudoceratinae TaxID=2713176 RepID=UPI0014212B45|nr:MerC domain-containing protein [Thalassoroseus pseudoceratinae]